MRLLAERARVVAEGAGALALAAAERVEGDTVCCIVSGGNIDAAEARGDPHGLSNADAHGGAVSVPCPRRYESAFAFSESNSACEIAPLSSSCFAFSISPAGPLWAATSLT